MLNYQELGGTELAKIINDREMVVINVAQNITKTVGNPLNKWLSFSLPKLPLNEINQIIANTILNGDNKENMWNSFIVVAFNCGADIKFKNTNDVDCVVEFIFPDIVDDENTNEELN